MKRKEVKQKQLEQHREYNLTRKIIVSTIASEKRKCLKTYGFAANPNKLLWENITLALKSMPASNL
jgi:hypothetical protein